MRAVRREAGLWGRNGRAQGRREWATKELEAMRATSGMSPDDRVFLVGLVMRIYNPFEGAVISLHALKPSLTSLTSENVGT